MNIVLSGAGVLTTAHIGAIGAIEEKLGDKFKINKMVGTSGGAMIGTFYSIGYTSKELLEITKNDDFEGLMKTGDPLIYNVLFNKGEYQATGLEKKMDEIIEAKTGKKECTFNDIPDIDLTLICININKQKVIEMNKNNTPNLVISKAIRMSFSVPFILTPVLYEGDYHIDGGYALYYAFGLVPKKNRLGVFIKSSYPDVKDINSYYEYIKCLMTITDSQIEYPDTIYVELTENINSYNISVDKMVDIYEKGKETAEKYIKEHPDFYVE